MTQHDGGETVADAPPLYVDLDGTLIETDVFLQSMLAFIDRHPTNALRLLAWLCQGPARAKAALAQCVSLDPATLPYAREVVTYVRDQRAKGRRIVLATAADRRYADAVAHHLGLFDGVLASDGHTNLKGRQKLAAILADCAHGPFVYAGDARADRPIWAKARAGIYVGAPKKDVARAQAAGTVEAVFTPRGTWRAALKDWFFGRFRP